MPQEECARFAELDALNLRRQCVRLVQDLRDRIASASPQIPQSLNDRGADIWEPLLVLADFVGGQWPQLARQAAVALTGSAQESNPIASLLLDICLIFGLSETDRVFSRTLVEDLNLRAPDRPWAEMRKGKEITGIWLSQQLRPYGIRPRNLWIGDDQGKGYYLEDFRETFQRYIPKAEAVAYLAELERPASETSAPNQNPPAIEKEDASFQPQEG